MLDVQYTGKRRKFLNKAVKRVEEERPPQTGKSGVVSGSRRSPYHPHMLRASWEDPRGDQLVIWNDNVEVGHWCYLCG